MSFPGVKINVENGNLLRAIAVLDGVGAIVATAGQPANIGVVRVVYSLQDAEQKGYTEADEPFLHKLISQFYAELGGNQQLYVFGTAETETMVDIVAATNADGLLKLLNESAGEVNLVAIARKPVSGYNAGTEFLDADVQATVLAAKPICQEMQRKNTPIRIFIEGRIANENAPINTFKPNESENGFVGVVLGNDMPDNSAAVGTVLGRACRFGAHIKLGSGQNGAVTVPQVYVGSRRIEERLDMETLHDYGYLTFMRRPGAAGYFFGVDNMAEKGDFRILVHGRVIDKAQRVIASAYLPYVETTIRVNPDGTLNSTDTADLENILTQALRTSMGEQASDFKVVIDPSQKITETSNLAVKASVQPLGYLTWITVTLGLAAQLSNN